MGEILPFPVSESYFRMLGSYEHHIPEEFFDSRSEKGKIIPFLVSKVLFPVSEKFSTYLGFLGLNEHNVSKEFCWSEDWKWMK